MRQGLGGLSLKAGVVAKWVIIVSFGMLLMGAAVWCSHLDEENCLGPMAIPVMAGLATLFLRNTARMIKEVSNELRTCRFTAVLGSAVLLVVGIVFSITFVGGVVAGFMWLSRWSIMLAVAAGIVSAFVAIVVSQW